MNNAFLLSCTMVALRRGSLLYNHLKLFVPALACAGFLLGAFSAVAETFDYWIYNTTDQTITDGNWTLTVKPRATTGQLAIGNGTDNAYVSGSGELDLTKPIYADAVGGTRWHGVQLAASCLANRLEITAIKLGATASDWTSIAGNNFNGCANVQSVDIYLPATASIAYSAFASLGSTDKPVTIKRVYAPEVTALNYGVFCDCRHGDGTAASIAENVYMPKLRNAGINSFRGYYTSAKTYTWTGDFRFPSLSVFGNGAFKNLRNMDVFELGRGTLTSVGTNSFEVGTIGNIIFGNGTNDLDLSMPLFRWTNVKALYFNGKKPTFPSGDAKWWTDHDSFNERALRLVIPRNDASWSDFVAEAQKTENQPTASELAYYRVRYPNCQDPIGKIPGSFLGLTYEQWLSYGNSEALLRDLRVESTAPVAVPGTSPAAGVWPTGKWYKSDDTETVTAPADWTKASDGFSYRAVGYVYERATDTGWTAPVTNAGTSVDVTFATRGTQRLTWLFERAIGGTASEVRTGASVEGLSVIKYGTGTSYLVGSDAVAPAEVRVDAGTLAFGALGSTNAFYRFTFKKMPSGANGQFMISEMRLCDADGNSTCGTGYTDAAADCVFAEMASKSIWCSRQDWYISDESESTKSGSPQYVLDGYFWRRLLFKSFTMNPDDSSTWVQLVLRLPENAGTTAGYNFNRAWSYVPISWSLETSADGVTWWTIDEQADVTPPTGDCAWCNDGTDFPLNAGNVRGGGGMAPTTPLTVKAGATFDGSFVGTSGQELAALVIDGTAGGGTLKGVHLAETGTLDLTNVADPSSLSGARVPLTFVDANIPRSLTGWTVRVNGAATHLRLVRRSDGLALQSLGFTVLFR